MLAEVTRLPEPYVVPQSGAFAIRHAIFAIVYVSEG